MRHACPTRTRVLVQFGIAAIIVTWLAPDARAGGGTCDFEPALARVRTLMQRADLAAAGLAVGTPRGLVLETYLGDGAYDGTTRVALASASKLLSGVRILQLVDRGAIDLDAPVSSVLPEFTGVKGTMTTRQMFSHTAGYGDDLDDPVLFADVTLAQAVSYVARNVEPPFPPPGAFFAYGGISMHVAGEVAEVRSGEDWQAGWIAHVGAPLGATSIDWQGLGPTRNYLVSGGAQSTLPDYARVLGMLLSDGVGQGRRILSPTAVATLAHDQTRGAELAYAPPGADGNHAYGIGAWIEPTSASTDAPLVTSVGKFGFAPWVDFDAGMFGALMVEKRETTVPTIGQLSHDAMLDLVALLRALPARDCALAQTWDPIFVDGLDAPP